MFVSDRNKHKIRVFVGNYTTSSWLQEFFEKLNLADNIRFFNRKSYCSVLSTFGGEVISEYRFHNRGILALLSYFIVMRKRERRKKGEMLS